MARPRRMALGGAVYHALNRGNDRKQIFDCRADYMAFEDLLQEAVVRFDMRLLAYCLMPNHWHLLTWPRLNGDLSRFMGWLTSTHACRWHTHRETVGTGHLYQGRFKSFPIQEDDHLLRVGLYIERNPLRANLVECAEDWPWSSLYRRQRGTSATQSMLSEWPVSRPQDWLDLVNSAQTQAELDAIRHCTNRGTPYGGDAWRDQTVGECGLECTQRPQGRPKKGA